MGSIKIKALKIDDECFRKLSFGIKKYVVCYTITNHELILLFESPLHATRNVAKKLRKRVSEKQIKAKKGGGGGKICNLIFRSCCGFFSNIFIL